MRPYPAYGPGSVSGTHSHDGRALYNTDLIQEMNTRLKAIEGNISKLQPLQKDVTDLTCKMTDLQLYTKSLSDRGTEVEKFCETFSDLGEDFINTKRSLQYELSNLKTLCISFGIDEAQPSNDNLNDPNGEPNYTSANSTRTSDK